MMNRLWSTPLLAVVVLLARAAAAGPNDGFTVTVDPPTRLDNPAVGQIVRVAVRATGTRTVKNVKLLAEYDPAVIEFSSYANGDVLPGLAPAFPVAPTPVGGGYLTAGGGAAILGATGVATTGGLLGTLAFRVVSPVPDEGSGIWLTLAQVGAAADDVDTLTLARGQVGVQLARRYVNRVFNLGLTRRFDGADLAWESRLPGLADTVRVRATGDSLWQTVTAARAAQFGTDLVTGARALLAAGLVADAAVVTVDAVLAGAGLSPPFAAAFRDSLVVLDRLLRSRRHVVALGGLLGDTQYEYEVRSWDLAGQASDRLTGTFRTRLSIDVRPAAAADLDVQATRTTVSTTWFTNRPADTRLVVTDSLGVEVAAVVLDPLGSLEHAASVAGLAPGTQYHFTVTSRLVGADALIAQGQLTEAEATVVKTGTFRTRTVGDPVRLLGPPQRIVSPTSAAIDIRLNQIAVATVAYGEATADLAGGAALYDESVRTGDVLDHHSVTLSDLVPATRYRYRISVVTPDGDSLSTDPRGNQQWSQDLIFTTSAAGDTLPPVIIEGPAVTIRDELAVVRFVTDVGTRATVFFGTRGGTYGTADEFEVADRTTDGSQRLSQAHSVIISGLQAGQAYDYGIVVSATNGQTASFEPNLPAGKAARASKRLKVLQPPGGAGSFTTGNQPDTQFPVILTGPSVSSKTHRTALIEWTTDEPATGRVDFGRQAVGQARQASGVSRTRHKMVLTNLEPDAPYLYQVATTDAAGNGATLSAQALFTTDPEVDLTAPAIVSAPQVSYRTDQAATIRWSTDEDATGEIAFGTAAADLGFIRAGASTGRDHSVTLTNLQPATTYHYRVASADLSNNGPTLGSVQSFTTDALPDVTPPVVTAVTVAADDSTAILAWTTDELADSFVDVGTVSGILDQTVGDAEDVTRHEVVLTNLTPGQTYHFVVGSSDRSGNGPTRSQELSFTTLDSADATPPATPAGLTATAGNRKAVLAWTAGTELDLAGYNVYRRPAGSGSFALVASRLTRPTHADLGVANDAAYEYRVTALDRATPPNESAPTAAVSLTPTLAAAPTAPAGLTVGGDPVRPTLTFVNAEPFQAGAALTYTVQVSTRADFADVTTSTSGQSAGAGTTSWTLTRPLDYGSTYFWRVRAVEGARVGPFSEASQFRAYAGPLVAGDFDDSGVVDLVDFFLFADAYDRDVAEVPYYDLDDSGPGTRIDLADFILFVGAYGTGAAKDADPTLALAALPVDPTLALRLDLAGGPLGGAGLPRDVVRLEVGATAATRLAAWGLVLTWDPAALTFTEAARPEAALLGEVGDAGLFRVLTQRPGRLTLVDGSPGGAPVTGDGSLAQLTFRVRDRRLASGTAVQVHQAFVSGGGGDVRRVAAVDAARLLPAAYALGAAYPNPFNPSTTIDFALPEATPARLVVYDVLGRRVRVLVRAETPLAAGVYGVTWDGRDEAGHAVGSGLYVYRLSTPGFARSGKMLLLK